jgi:uncharacterized membrane protein YwzB
MSQFWRNSAITGVGLFLESCSFYLLIAIISAALQQREAALPFWLVFLSLGWAYLLSFYVQTLRFSLNLRSAFGLMISVASILFLSHLSAGLGFNPVGAILGGGLDAAIRMVLTLAFLVFLWWRGGTIAHDEVTQETVQSSFRWGLVMVFAAVLTEGLTPAHVVNGFLIVGFFAVGLAGLSLARFSSEAGDSQVMSLDWLIPIGVSVGGVLLLGVVVSVVGLGGLDDVTRALLGAVGNAGLWILHPVLLAMGYLAGLLVQLGNWLSGLFGGGDLSGLLQAEAQMRQFHEDMAKKAGNTGPPALLVAFLKWAAFLAAAGLVCWLLLRVFRVRRLGRGPREVEETRESLFTWTRANQDLSSLLSDWWKRLMPVGEGSRRRQPEPLNPRELYQSLLALAEQLGQPRRHWQTPKEHQRALQELLPMQPVGRIVDGFQLVHYGRGLVVPGEMERLLLDWAAVRQHVSEQHQGA